MQGAARGLTLGTGPGSSSLANSDVADFLSKTHCLNSCPASSALSPHGSAGSGSALQVEA